MTFSGAINFYQKTDVGFKNVSISTHFWFKRLISGPKIIFSSSMKIGSETSGIERSKFVSLTKILDAK